MRSELKPDQSTNPKQASGYQSQRTKRDPAIEILRWGAICAVVIQHAAPASRYSQHALDFVVFSQEMLGWCVLAFFGISGYLFNRQKDFITWFTKRCGRLLLPYICVSVIAYFSLLVVVKTGIYQMAKPPDLSLITLIKRIISGSGVGPQLYFLPYLLIVSTFAFGLLRIFSAGWSVAILGSIASLELLANGPSGTIGPNPHHFPLYALAYLGGYYLAVADHKTSAIFITSGALIGLVSSVFCGSNIVGHLFLPSLLYVALRRLEWPKSLATFLGKYSSGAVYLWHAPLMLPASSVILNKLGVHDVANFILACTLTIVFSALMGKVVDRFGAGRYLSL